MVDGTAGDGRFWAPGRVGDRTALVHAGTAVRGDELDHLVERRATTIDGGRLVLLSGGNDLEFVVTYLAALRVGAPIILNGPDERSERSLIDAYDPDVVVRTAPAAPTCRTTGDTPAGSDGPTCRILTRHAEPAHRLHPDLAVLLSTSGSTGSPKLVRLSHDNLASNARAIASYLGLGPDDVGVTSLPLHYCYGLSVLNSHLAAGAPVVLTDLSVVDPCFWTAARRHGVTNLAGVPLTFELLERAGSPELDLPSMRFLTQAGGRMEPERVRRVAIAARTHGIDLFVMYGQTEATARMAYLPPGLAAERPGAVGVPVPGGEIGIRPLPADEAPAWPADAGEIVYRGPNVMLGYAERVGDLARGRDVHELVTGDVGRRAPDGLVEVVGRRSRFVKLCGLRLDLDRLESLLREDGIEALCVGDDHGVLVGHVAAGDGAGPTEVAATAALHLGVPTRMVDVVELPGPLPRTSSGKPDRSGLRDLLGRRVDARTDHPARNPDGPPATGPGCGRGVAELYASVLGVDRVAGDRTFVSAGGDSLSYVEVAMGLEELLGSLPEAWHLRTVDELEALRRPVRARRWRRVETGVALRALAVVVIVGNHMDLHRIPGGAHVLLAVAGFNLARFTIDARRHGDRWRDRLRPVARIAVPTSLWVLLTLVVAGGTSLGAVLLVNNYVGSPSLDDERWRYWFIEVLVQLLLLSLVLLSVPAVRRFERRRPFVLPLLLLAPALLVRHGWLAWDDTPRYAFRTHHVAWVFLLGWAASRARTTGQRLTVSALTVAAGVGFFDDPLRDGVLVAGLLALTWFDHVRVPAVAARAAAAVAAASLYVYLTHYEVFPPLQRLLPDVVALALTVLVGIAVARALGWATARIGRSLRQREPAASAQSVAGPRVASSKSDSAPMARAPTA